MVGLKDVSSGDSMTGIYAKVIEDSISESGKRITTLQVRFHRFVLSEFNTHRVFSRNFSSSRAIPTKKLLEQVRNDPAMPVHWGKNQPGMQANEELDSLTIRSTKASWIAAANEAASRAAILAEIGVHKQIVNRLIEPFLWANGIVTSTEWDNWDALRDHDDAQPEIHELAIRMREARNGSTPRLLKFGEWHLPYISEDERNDQFFKIPANRNMLQKISAARCCRVSYLKHDGQVPDVNDDLALFQRLAGAVPRHLSPLEHQATPIETDPSLRSHLDAYGNMFSGNLKGWLQYRNLFLYEEVGHTPPWTS